MFRFHMHAYVTQYVLHEYLLLFPGDMNGNVTYNHPILGVTETD